MGQAERRSTKRRGRSSGSWAILANQLSWTQPRYVDPPLTPLSSDQIEAIHEASLDILDSIGIMFLNDEALDILASAGCDVNRSTKIVKMDRQWV
ncbi:MAG: trimethylamine methyltransferase family protein, partial [Alphaproteobacteria bacterium]|nr:trimethylamine methyltransferase family protein [Alphaproteobacteria bacterium]